MNRQNDWLTPAQTVRLWDQLLRGGVARDDIHGLTERMEPEHLRWIIREAMEPKPCPNCSNQFDARLLEDARLDGQQTMVCQGCRSTVWLVVDEEHYGTVPALAPASDQGGPRR
jgi:hypothetical protein